MPLPHDAQGPLTVRVNTKIIRPVYGMVESEMTSCLDGILEIESPRFDLSKIM